MAKPNWLTWFATPSGRNFSSYAGAVAGACCFASYLLPHHLFIGKTKSFLRMYKDDQPVQLPEPLQTRAEQVLEATQLTKKEKGLVSFFTAFGFDVLHAGSTKLSNGAIIGIPISFSYRSLSDVDQSQLSLLNQPEFSWQSRSGQRILTTLLLSNRAQQFAIAREIYYANTHYVYMNGFVAASNFILAFTAGRYINTRLDLYARPLRQRLGLYGILGSLAGLVFVIMKDLITTSNESFADRRAADLGKDFILGGVEYYEYLIERNKALRDALGKNGDKYYTPGGNVKEWLRVSRIPLTNRFEYMKKRLHNIESVQILDISDDEAVRNEMPKPSASSPDITSKETILLSEKSNVEAKKLKL